MRYRLSNKAAQDLLDIYAYGVREFGMPAADKYHEGLASTFEFLADNPHAARERSEFSPPVRIHPSGSHIVVYTIGEEGVFIVRVLGGRQDWERYL